ncbi:MAG: DUF3343 domain-containing protein [bacterium]|nr:DUF3343 domain-containing protein [bacterium]
MAFCLVTFLSKHHRFQAEELFHRFNITFDLIPPPVWLRTNCDNAFRFAARYQVKAEELLTRNKVGIEQWVTASEEPVTLSDRLKQHLIMQRNKR